MSCTMKFLRRRSNTMWQTIVLVVGVLGLLVAPHLSDGLALSHLDLESANETCDGKSTCQPEQSSRGPGLKSRLDLTLDWKDRNCMCDQLCAIYGDCCVDSTHFSSAEQRRGIISFQCVELRQFGGVYMIASCPPHWEGRTVRERCEENEMCSKCKLGAKEASCDKCDEDPISSLPVTSHKSSLTYRNTFCAICHDDFTEADVDLWAPRLECPSPLNVTLTEELAAEKLTYNRVLHSWGLNLTAAGGKRSSRVGRDLISSNFRARNMKRVKPETQFKHSATEELNGHSRPSNLVSDTFISCHVDPVIPETATHLVRRCQPGVIKTCATNWTNVDIRNRCEAYTSTVYQSSLAFRNPHCGLCNNVPIQYLSCTKTASQRAIFNKDFSPRAFSVLFDFRSRGRRVGVGKKKMCLERELYDPFFKKCRNVFDADLEGGKKVVEVNIQLQEATEASANNFYDSEGKNNSLELLANYSQAFLTCKKVILDPDDFILDESNETIYIEKYKKKYGKGDFLIVDNGLLEICADFQVEYVDKFGAYMGYITFVGLGVSIAFLILHLLAFALVKDLRNLSGKNLASFCLSLLCAYSCFLIGQLPVGGSACKFLGFFTYYSFLASFFWMLTISFDIFRTLRLATSELRVSLGSQRKKFAAYSLFAWVSPLLIVCTSVGFEFTGNPYMPGFGNSSCWFSNKSGLLLFFVGPLAIIMALNILFFAFSAHMIYTTRHSTLARAVSSSTSRTRRDFKLYIRLSLVMGLTWVVGLVAGYLDVEVLWYIFIALNTLQGLFIFLAFTCNEKVMKGVGHMLRPARRGSSDTERAKRGPPSFSWSGVSSLTPHSEESRKTELSNPDTLY